MANEETAETNEQMLYRHARRPEWGVAALISAANGRRSYQFEDGTLRTLKEEYCGFMEAAQQDSDTSEQLRTALEEQGQRMLARKRATRQARSKNNAKPVVILEPVMNLTQQVQVFLSLYPGGFDDPEYIKEIRGTSDGPQRKRLRTPAIDIAQELLAAEIIKPLLEQEQTDKIVERLRRVLQRCDLVRAAQDVRPLAELSIIQQDRVAKALCELLYGTGSDAERLAAWISALAAAGMPATWATVTAPVALVRPTEYIAIRPSVFGLQARLLAPDQRLNSKPSATHYGWIRDMAFRLDAHLKKVGQQPRDLMDIYEFVWLTLRPNGQKTLTSLAPA
ncbi:MAG: hypothetical protein ACI8S6_002221 [Myxococcota bacterium]|jgi:hypothetical protein